MPEAVALDARDAALPALQVKCGEAAAGGQGLGELVEPANPFQRDAGSYLVVWWLLPGLGADGFCRAWAWAWWLLPGMVAFGPGMVAFGPGMVAFGPGGGGCGSH